MTSAFKVIEHTLPGQHIREYPQSTRHKQEDILSISIKQYIPLTRPNPPPEHAVTILGFHGNGFPKEAYEPFFEDLCADLSKRNVPVRGIWIADSSNQGMSGVLNEYIQGDQTAWFDHSRDVLHMVNHFRDEMPRPIIGVAHSYGCAQLVHLSTIHPRLLSTVILMEPIIFSTVDWPQGMPSPAIRSLFRRDIWPSREEAEKSLRKAFGNWDPRSLDKYLQYNLRQTPTAVYHNTNGERTKPSKPDDKPPPNPLPPGAVTLTTTKAQESWSFLHYNGWPLSLDPQQKGLNRLAMPDQSEEDEWSSLGARPETRLARAELPFLRPSALFVHGSKASFSIPALIQEKRTLTGTAQGGSGGAKEGKVTSVIIQGGDHLITFEKAAQNLTVVACAEWLGTWFNGWLADEALVREHLDRKQGRASDSDLVRLSPEWVEFVKMPMGTPRPTRGREKL